MTDSDNRIRSKLTSGRWKDFATHQGLTRTTVNMETCSKSDLRELKLNWEDVTASAAAVDRQLCGPLRDVCEMN